MVRIVLSEMERDGTFTPALAVTTGDETEALTCTIQGVVRNLTAYANRLGSVGKLSNRIDISQAMGGVPQAINFDFDLIDWDGFSRVSVAMLEGTARFVGWEVSVIVDSAPPISLAVQNASANGDTISFHCVSRFELTSRPCAFGAGAQQVGLVVGGHDVSVETNALEEPVGIFRASREAAYQGNPLFPVLFFTSSNKATSKSESGGQYFLHFACGNLGFANEFVASLDRSRWRIFVGAEFSTSANVFYFLDTIGGVPAVSMQIPKWFYDSENAEDVGIFQGVTSGAVAAGAVRMNGFIDSGMLFRPFGEATIEGGVLSFAPSSLVPDGFTSFTLLDSDIAWKLQGLEISDYYGMGTEIIATDGTDPGVFDAALMNGLPPASSTRFTVWDFSGSLSAFLPLVPSLQIDWSPDKIIVDLKARLKIDFANNSEAFYRFPFTNQGQQVLTSSPQTIEFNLRGPGYFSPLLRFDSVDDLKSKSLYSVIGSAGFFAEANFQLLACAIYGQKDLAFGSNSAVVTPGAGPLDAPEGTYPARQTGGVTLPEAAACIISANGWFPQEEGNYPVGTVPTWNAPASAVGEYIDPAKSFIEAAELLAQESWAIFALEQNAIGTADELPDPPRIQLGQDTDVITEPTIEYQLFGGKYLGKAYISNVDLPFDSTNASAFYGGWGLAPAGAEEAEGTDYGYLIWQRCRAAFLAHGIKRGQTYQFNGIHDAQTMGRMWWEAKRNGYRRIDWLAFHPRYMTFSVKRFNSFGWAGSSTRLPQIMAGGAGYDVAAWGPLYNDSVTVVAVDADPMTGITEFSVALPPVVTDGHDIGLTTDTLNNTLDLSPDTLDSGLPLTTDTLEA